MAFREKEWILREIIGTHEAITRAIGRPYPLRLFRPPYGRFDPRFRRILEGLGYRMVLWSLLSGDFSENSAEQLIRKVDDHIHPGAVIVFHDGHSHGPVLIQALPRILRRIRDRGFQFRSLPDPIFGPSGGGA
jgi:peptidoglycan/xylan/chitin deacetylase (PgdA/CDA1 family)